MRTLLLPLLMLITLGARAQVRVAAHREKHGVKPIRAADLARLKATTTLFILPDIGNALSGGFEQAIIATWHITPCKVTRIADVNEYKDKPGYSWFLLALQGGTADESSFYAYRGRGWGSPLANINYSLVIARASAEIKMQTVEAGRLGFPFGRTPYFTLFLPPDSTTTGRTELARIFIDFETEFDEHFMQPKPLIHAIISHTNDVNKAAVFPYWTPGMLATYLRTVSEQLTAGTCTKPYPTRYTSPTLTALRSDTLYMLNYVANYLTSAPAAAISGATDSTITAVYPYPIHFVSATQLSDLIINSLRPVTFLMHGRKPRGGSFIKVYNTVHGVIYTAHVHDHKRTGIFHASDLRALAGAIENP